MIYEIYFVENEFKDLISDSLINDIIIVKEDEFVTKQLANFFKVVTKEEVYNNLQTNIGFRDDVIIDDDIIVYKNQVTGKSAKLSIGSDGGVYINTNDKENPLIMSLSKDYNLILHEIH